MNKSHISDEKFAASLCLNNSFVALERVMSYVGSRRLSYLRLNRIKSLVSY